MLYFQFIPHATAEYIETTVTKTSSKINFKCQVKNLKHLMQYCRFVRVDDNFGLNLVDGIGVDRYQYYGDGMKNGDCGMEIMNPNAGHMTQWKCYIGMMDVDDAANVKIADVNKRIYKYSALMDASDDWENLKSKFTFCLLLSFTFSILLF